MAEFFPLWWVKGINKFKSLKALLNQRKNIIHGEKHLKKKKKTESYKSVNQEFYAGINSFWILNAN